MNKEKPGIGSAEYGTQKERKIHKNLHICKKSSTFAAGNGNKGKGYWLKAKV